jgi:hypothetical protein
MFGNGGKSHRIHFKYGSRRNQVADGPEENGELAKIVDRGGVKKDKVWFRKHGRKAFQRQLSAISRQITFSP